MSGKRENSLCSEGEVGGGQRRTLAGLLAEKRVKECLGKEERGQLLFVVRRQQTGVCPLRAKSVERGRGENFQGGWKKRMKRK